MRKVPAPKVVTTAGGVGESAASADPGGARRARRGSEGGPARAQRRRRARRRARADGARGRRGRRPEGQARPATGSPTRHGHEDGSMTLGGRRVPVRRPRMRTADDERELPVETYEYFADRDPLTRAVMDRMLAGVSTRKFARVGEPVGAEVEAVVARRRRRRRCRSCSSSAPRTALGELMSRRLDDVRLAVMMLDGLEIADRTHVVALGITTEGVKIPLGLWEGSTENATLARTLLADLVDRGLDPEQAILFVIDGGKALRARDQGRLRRARARASLPSPQGAQRLRSAARARPRPGPRADARGVVADRRRAGRAAAAAARRRARPDVARRRRLAARGHGRHADADAARDHRAARQDAVLDEPVRVDDRDRPLHPAQREALAATATCASAGPPPACSSPSSSSDGSSATATSPSSSSPSSVTPSSPPPTNPDRQRGRRARYRLTVNPRGSPSKFHDDPDILASDPRHSRCISFDDGGATELPSIFVSYRRTDAPGQAGRLLRPAR